MSLNTLRHLVFRNFSDFPIMLTGIEDKHSIPILVSRKDNTVSESAAGRQIWTQVRFPETIIMVSGRADATCSINTISNN